MNGHKVITWENHSREQLWNDFDELLESSLANVLSFIWLAFENRSAPSLHMGTVLCSPWLIGGKVEMENQSVDSMPWVL